MLQGELVAQKIRTGTVTLQRNTLAYLVAGSTQAAPFFHWWFPFMERVLVPAGKNTLPPRFPNMVVVASVVACALFPLHCVTVRARARAWVWGGAF